jgi:hypothetical protein
LTDPVPVPKTLGLAGICPAKARFGAVAQLGERLVRNEEASGSIPLSSTIFNLLGKLEMVPSAQ